MNTTHTITVNDVSCAIGGRTILRNVSFDIPGHARIALIGTNGAGKSTLLRALAGINTPTTGTVHLDDRNIHTMPAAHRAHHIAFVGQEETPPEELLLHEVVALGRVPHRKPWSGSNEGDEYIIAECLHHMNLLDYAHRPSHQLSGGQRRRAMIARGLAQHAPILMLDEPTNHLDVTWQHQLLTQLNHYNGTVVAAIHDLDLVYQYFTHVAVIHDGTVAHFGTPHDVLTPELVRLAFGVDLAIVENPITGQHQLLTFPLHHTTR